MTTTTEREQELEERILALEVERNHWKALAQRWESLADNPGTLPTGAPRERYTTPRDRKAARLIIEHTAKAYGIATEDLLSLKRTETIALARSVAIYLLRDLAGLSSTKTAEVIGRTHSNVVKMTQRVRAKLDKSANFHRWTMIIRAHCAAAIEKSARTIKHNQTHE